jgi:hypothetical protein
LRRRGLELGRELNSVIDRVFGMARDGRGQNQRNEREANETEKGGWRHRWEGKAGRGPRLVMILSDLADQTRAAEAIGSSVLCDLYRKP